jgi:hypothetical protein
VIKQFSKQVTVIVALNNHFVRCSPEIRELSAALLIES